MLSEMCIVAANYLINKTNNYNDGKKYSEQISMTCKRLQKLLYFSEVEHMKANNGAAMFTDDFHAWPSGPVIPSVYDVFVQFQDGKMHPVDENGHSPITDDMEKVLEKVFLQTIQIDTLDLVEYSHVPDGPWAKHFDASDDQHLQIIPKEEIYMFYQNRIALSK